MPLSDYAKALLIVVVWGVNFVVIKWGLAGLPPLLLGALRFTLAALPAIFLIRRPAVPWRWLVAYGLTVGLCQFGFLFSALYVGMPAGLASVVLQSQAFLTLVLAACLIGEHWTRPQLAGLLFAGAGLALIGASHGHGMTLLGFLFTVAAATCWAASNIVVRKMTQEGHHPDMLALVVWSSLVPPLPFLALSLAIEGPSTVWAALAGFSLQSLAAVAYLSFGATLLGYSLWSGLLARHPANRVAPFSLLIPVVGLSTAALLLDEWPSPLQWGGSALLIVGLVVNVFGGAWMARIRARADRA